MGVLKAQGYNVPANGMTVASGIGGIISGLVGAHNANIAGPMTAICSSQEAGPKEGRYAASFWNGLTFAAFGVVGSFAIAFVSFIPTELVNVLAGLAMLNVLIQAFSEGFGTLKYKTGAVLCPVCRGLWPVLLRHRLRVLGAGCWRGRLRHLRQQGFQGGCQYS